MEHGSIAQDRTQAKGVCHLLRQDYRLLFPHQPLVRIAQYPQRTSGKAMAHHASILPVAERMDTVLLGVVECHTLCIVHMRSGSSSQVEQVRPQGTVCCYKHAG